MQDGTQLISHKYVVATSTDVETIQKRLALGRVKDGALLDASVVEVDLVQLEVKMYMRIGRGSVDDFVVGTVENAVGVPYFDLQVQEIVGHRFGIPDQLRVGHIPQLRLQLDPNTWIGVSLLLAKQWLMDKGLCLTRVQWFPRSCSLPTSSSAFPSL